MASTPTGPISADSAMSAMSGSGLAALKEAAGPDTSIPAAVIDPNQPPQAPQPEQKTDALPGDQAVKPPDAKPTESPSETAKPAFDVTDPAARRFLEMHGGDPTKPETWTAALAKGLEYNNRLAELSKRPEATPEPPVEIQVPDEQVNGYLERLIAQDQECQQYIRQRNEALTRIQAIGIDPQTGVVLQASGEIRDLENQIQIAKLRLEIPEIKADSFQTAELREFIRNSTLDIRDKKAEYRELREQIREAVMGFGQRATTYKDGITQRLRSQIAEKQETERQEQDYNTAYKATPKLFADAMARAVAKHGIPDYSKTDFEKYVKMRSISQTYTADIDNWDAQFDAAVPEFREMVDRHHRAQAAIYSTQKTQATETPGPTPQKAVAGQAPQPTRTGDPISNLMNDGFRRLRDLARGA